MKRWNFHSIALALDQKLDTFANVASSTLLVRAPESPVARMNAGRTRRLAGKRQWRAANELHFIARDREREQENRLQSCSARVRLAGN
jgi:hypothetical protein